MTRTAASFLESGHYLEVTHLDPIKLIQNAYLLSKAQGLGLLHYVPNDRITDEEAKRVLEDWEPDERILFDLDYVRGRAVKLTVFKAEGRYFMRGNGWYDHTEDQLKELLEKSVK